MITRPLDLAHHLRPEPRSADGLFYINAGLIVLFFVLFGSRFVLSPGLGVDFRLPEAPEARAGAAPTDCYISVRSSGQIFAGDGLLSLSQLGAWLRDQAGRAPRHSLLIRASAGVPIDRLTEISSLAYRSGFARVVWGAEMPAGPGGGGP